MRYRIDGARSHFSARATSGVHDTNASGGFFSGDISLPSASVVSLPQATAELALNLQELACKDRLSTSAMRRHFALAQGAVASIRLRSITSVTGTDDTFGGHFLAEVTFRGRVAELAAPMTGSLTDTQLSLRVACPFDLHALGLSPPRVLWMSVSSIIALDVTLVATAAPAL